MALTKPRSAPVSQTPSAPRPSAANQGSQGARANQPMMDLFADDDDTSCDLTDETLVYRREVPAAPEPKSKAPPIGKRTSASVRSPIVLKGAPSQPAPPPPKSSPPPSERHGPKAVEMRNDPPAAVAAPTAPAVVVMAEAPPSVEQPSRVATASAGISHPKTYAFALDSQGLPIELGSGRHCCVFLGEEFWPGQDTAFRQQVAIKMLRADATEMDIKRFEDMNAALSRAQGHSQIIRLFAAGKCVDGDFIPEQLKGKVLPNYLVVERMDLSLEEYLEGHRSTGDAGDISGFDPDQRIRTVLDFLIPVASAIEYAHLVRDTCHGDVRPGNIMLRMPDARLEGSNLELRLANFAASNAIQNDARTPSHHSETSASGALSFLSPEQETASVEVVVHVQQGSDQVEFLDNSHVQGIPNDYFAVLGHGETYRIAIVARTHKSLTLSEPYRGPTQKNARARINKQIGRPTDIYSLGAVLYYLASGAYASPKALYYAFLRFIEYNDPSEDNTIAAYLDHEYAVLRSIQAQAARDRSPGHGMGRVSAQCHYLGRYGEMIDPRIMSIVARCMIRNKPDSYCQSHDLTTRGISALVKNLKTLRATLDVSSDLVLPDSPMLDRQEAFRAWIRHAMSAIRTAQRRLHVFWLVLKPKMAARFARRKPTELDD